MMIGIATPVADRGTADHKKSQSFILIRCRIEKHNPTMMSPSLPFLLVLAAVLAPTSLAQVRTCTEK
jgi:hypothetical protein